MIFPCFLVLDFIWIGLLMAPFYDRELGELARRSQGVLSPRWGAAVLVYLLIPSGLVVFVRPLLLERNLHVPQAFGLGAFFGLVIYGVYDLTNRAVLQNWSLPMTVIDIIWGSCVCGVMAIMMRFAR